MDITSTTKSNGRQSPMADKVPWSEMASPCRREGVVPRTHPCDALHVELRGQPGAFAQWLVRHVRGAHIVVLP